MHVTFEGIQGMPIILYKDKILTIKTYSVFNIIQDDLYFAIIILLNIKHVVTDGGNTWYNGVNN